MIEWSQIDTKGKVNGAMKTTCPNCSHTRKKQKDPCLSVNLDKGCAKCWNCEEIAWREPLEFEQKEYVLPPQEWQNHTNISDKLVKWWASRGISQRTLLECKITEERIFIPRDGKEMNCTVFNYFHRGSLVNKKYRSGSKGFTQIKNAKKVFYGIDSIVGEDECFIVEGEADRLAMWEAGYKNTISVPNGANDLNDIFDTCKKEIESITTFIIAVDMDDAGLKLEDEITKRLGKNKCKRVKWQGKDANDDLISLKIDESIKAMTAYPIEGTYSTIDLSDSIDDLYTNGLPEPLKLKALWAQELNSKWSILKGQLTVITGIPSHGKSNFIEWYILNLMVEHGFKSSFFSPEHLPMQLHHAYLAEKVIGKPFQSNSRQVDRMSKTELTQYKEWSKDKLFLTAPPGGKQPSWEWIMETFKEQIYRYGIDIFVIDAFNKVKRETDGLKEISDILGDLSMFCQHHNVHIFLIAHPTKMRKQEGSSMYTPPTLYDIKGSGDFNDQTHNGGTVYRIFDVDGGGHSTFTPLKMKFRHQGSVDGSSVAFKYNPYNGRYNSLGGSPDYSNLLNSNDRQQEIVNEVDEYEWLNQPLTSKEPPF